MACAAQHMQPGFGRDSVMGNGLGLRAHLGNALDGITLT